jgi:anaerobic magnesium-protoporphyrin IX monomethyl ester cyclase
MNKNFQNFQTIYESAARCVAAGVQPSFNIIFAFPGEGPRERKETIRFMMDVCRRFHGAEFWTSIFTPYPGSPIMEKVAELGIELPESFEGWVDFFPRYTKLPWLNGRDHEQLQVMRDYLRIAFDRVPIGKDRRTRVTRLAQKCISFPARWRLDHGVYGFPVDLWLNDKLKERTAGYKPVVDARRLEPNAIEAAC